MSPDRTILRRVLLGLLGAAVLGAAGARSGSADEACAGDRADEIGALLAGLGRTPSVDAVRAVVSHAKVKADGSVARDVADRLSTTGGVACATGLVTLASHSEATVRAAALDGVARLRIRLSDGAMAVRRCLGDADASVRSAAFDAMGTVADASDVPRLVDDVGSECPVGSGCAYRALLKLTELRLPKEPRRWRDWWATAQKDVPPRLDAAIARVLSATDAVCPAEDCEFIGRFAWIDLKKVVDATRECLRSSEPRRRATGYRLVAAARLGDLADDVASNLRYERDAAAFEAGAPAATLLGLRIDDAALLLDRCGVR